MKFVVAAIGWAAITMVAIFASNVVYIENCEHPAKVNTRVGQLRPMLEECKAVQPGMTIAAAHDLSCRYAAPVEESLKGNEMVIVSRGAVCTLTFDPITKQVTEAQGHALRTPSTRRTSNERRNRQPAINIEEQVQIYQAHFDNFRNFSYIPNVEFFAEQFQLCCFRLSDQARGFQ